MQDKIAETLSDIGIEYETEKRSADGNFSMDFYLPRYDVALEYDGPSHYYRAWRAEDRAFPRTPPGFPRDEEVSVMKVPLWTVGKEKTIKTILRDELLERGQVSKVVTVHAHEAFWFENKRGRRRVFVENLLRRELGRPMTPGTPEWWFDEAGTNAEEEEVSDATPDATSDATSAALEDVAGGETSSSTSRAELARRWIRSLPSKSAREAGAAPGAGGRRGGSVDAGGGVRGGGRHEGEGGVATGGFGGARVTCRVIELLFELESLSY